MPRTKIEITEESLKTIRYVSKTIRKRLDEVGENPFSLCKKTGMSRTTLCNILSGDRSFSFRTLVEFLDVLDLKIKIVKK